MEFGECFEAKILNGILIGLNIIVGEFKQMHDAEMDAPYFTGVVIDQSEHLLSVSAADDEFLRHFTLDAVVVHRLAECVLGCIDWVDMTSDADRAFRD